MSDTAAPLAQRNPTKDRPERSGAAAPEAAVEGVRMSFGDHLEELRSSLIRALLGFGIGAVVCLIFGKEILGIIFRPLLAAQHANGLTLELQALSPTAGFNAYLKIALLAGLIVAMPWVIYQVWRFVAAGLYESEKRFARIVGPASGGLFLLGVVFMYYVVLPIVLNFFIAFNASFEIPDLSAQSQFQALLFGEEKVPAPVLPDSGVSQITILRGDPANPVPGTWWVDVITNRLKVQTDVGIMSMPLEHGASGSPIHSQFAIDFYIGFVLDMALAFGLAFQLPVLVYFLAWLGIVSAAAMGAGRKYVILSIAFAAAILTPPDVLSQMLLAVPMWGLFEVGLLLATWTERKNAAKA